MSLAASSNETGLLIPAATLSALYSPPADGESVFVHLLRQAATNATVRASLRGGWRRFSPPSSESIPAPPRSSETAASLRRVPAPRRTVHSIPSFRPSDDSSSPSESENYESRATLACSFRPVSAWVCQT